MNFDNIFGVYNALALRGSIEDHELANMMYDVLNRHIVSLECEEEN